MTRWTEADVSAYRKRRGDARPAPKPAPVPRQRSELESLLEAQIKAEGLFQGCETEHRWHPTRRWRLDFAWIYRRCGVEATGMVHRIKGRFKGDIEKRAELTLAGWRVLEVDGDSIRDGRAIQWIKRLLENRNG